MNTNRRHFAPWKYSEVDSLYREYELLELTPEQIAEKHQRTVYAILYRLKKEGIIDDEARNGWCLKFNSWEKIQAEKNDVDYDLSDYSSDHNSDLDDEESYYSGSNDDSDADYEESESESDDNLSEESENYHYHLKKNESENEKFKVEMNGRILKLEESMFDMKTMVASLLKKFTSSSNGRPPLRSYV